MIELSIEIRSHNVLCLIGWVGECVVLVMLGCWGIWRSSYLGIWVTGLLGHWLAGWVYDLEYWTIACVGDWVIGSL